MFRAVWPIARFGRTYLVTRHDDVRQVFAEDGAFGVPYKAKLDVIMGGEPFMLGMADGSGYRDRLMALRRVVRPGDLPMLAGKVEASAQAIVTEAGGRLDVVDTLVRRISFDFLADYLGVPHPTGGDLRVWGTRLFEFQFVADDAPLRAEVAEIAPALGRCLALQQGGEPGYDDRAIGAAVVGLIVGGPPQPPMVLPQALEQLLRRPEALARASAAARDGDDRLLAAHIYEAMRFDPLAPWFTRRTLVTHTVGGAEIPVGSKVLAAVGSAMRDEARVPEPKVFDVDRSPDQYLHFGFGVHQCFGLEINPATLHLMLKPLLARPNLRRAAGRAGHLRKQGPFASSLVVEFD